MDSSAVLMLTVEGLHFNAVFNVADRQRLIEDMIDGERTLSGWCLVIVRKI